MTCSLGLSACSSAPLAPLPKEALDDGKWEVAQLKFKEEGSTERIQIDRYRADLAKPIAVLPYEAVFQVKLRKPPANGVFAEDDLPQMKVFEDTLVREIQGANEGSIFCVHTSEGIRRTVFYTQKDLASQSQTLLDKCPAGYDYSFSSRFDPDWTDFSETKARLKNAKTKSIDEIKGENRH